MSSAIDITPKENKEKFLSEIEKIKKKVELNKENLTPCYLFDKKEVENSIARLHAAFLRKKIVPNISYALKSNPYHGIVNVVSDKGHGVDVSSVQELSCALKANAKKIVVTGPGKTKETLLRFIKTPEVKIIYLDSIIELQRLSEILKDKKIKKMPLLGIRVAPECLASWDKFGVLLKDVSTFLKTAYNLGFQIEALQFHISYVKDAYIYKKAFKELRSEFLKKDLKIFKEKIQIIDIGGGFVPENFDGNYPWNKKEVSLFDVSSKLKLIEKAEARNRAKFSYTQPIEKMAQIISDSWRKIIAPTFKQAKLYIQPGRYISHRSMHILLQVVDKKNDKSVILNGGWNMLGWEKYQYLSYAPTFNLTRWNPKLEFPLIMYGNLCLPDDIWGYYLHGNAVEIDDIILIPFQGAYTYTYRQEFIRGIPKVVDI